MKGIRSLILPAKLFVSPVESKTLSFTTYNNKNYITLSMYNSEPLSNEYNSLLLNLADELLLQTFGDRLLTIFNDYFGILVDNLISSPQPYPFPDSGQQKTMLITNKDSMIFGAQRVASDSGPFPSFYFPSFTFGYFSLNSVDLRDIDLSSFQSIFSFTAAPSHSIFSFLVPNGVDPNGSGSYLLQLEGDGIFETNIYTFSQNLVFEHYDNLFNLGLYPQNPYEFPYYQQALYLYPRVVIGEEYYYDIPGVLEIYGKDGSYNNFRNQKYFYFDSNTGEKYWLEEYDYNSVERINNFVDGVSKKTFIVDSVIIGREFESREQALINSNLHNLLWLVPRNPDLPTEYKRNLGYLADFWNEEFSPASQLNSVFYKEFTPVFGVFEFRGNDSKWTLSSRNMWNMDLHQYFQVYTFVLSIPSSTTMINDDRYIFFSMPNQFDFAIRYDTGNSKYYPTLRMAWSKDSGVPSPTSMSWIDNTFDLTNFTMELDTLYYLTILVSANQLSPSGNAQITIYLYDVFNGTVINDTFEGDFDILLNYMSQTFIGSSTNPDLYLYYLSVSSKAMVDDTTITQVAEPIINSLFTSLGINGGGY